MQHNLTSHGKPDEVTRYSSACVNYMHSFILFFTVNYVQVMEAVCTSEVCLLLDRRVAGSNPAEAMDF
jgi:hypothetical protein